MRQPGMLLHLGHMLVVEIEAIGAEADVASLPLKPFDQRFAAA